MLPAVMPITEPTITHDPLRRLATLFVRASDLLGRHAAAERGGEVNRAVLLDVVVCEGGGGGEVFAAVDEAQG